VLPTERSDMSEEIIADDDALSAQVLNGTIEVDGVPVDGSRP
jgi:hypothetical protein